MIKVILLRAPCQNFNGLLSNIAVNVFRQLCRTQERTLNIFLMTKSVIVCLSFKCSPRSPSPSPQNKDSSPTRTLPDSSTTCTSLFKCVYIIFSMRTPGLLLLRFVDVIFENYCFAM